MNAQSRPHLRWVPIGRLFASLVLASCLPLAPQASAQTTRAAPNDQVEAGVAALERGHFAIAMRAFRADAAKGNALAASNIGYLYERGLGVPQNYAEAMAWYRKAAAQGLAQAQFNIGTLYFQGWGVERNTRESFAWFRRAALQDLPEAQYMVGLAYLEGHGTSPQASLALDWFLKSARQAYPAGQMMAAQVFLSGDAGKEEPAKAYVWADAAAKAGLTDASLVRDYASYRLSARDLERARSASQACQNSGFKDCLSP
jgi:TPR repeat protein